MILKKSLVIPVIINIYIIYILYLNKKVFSNQIRTGPKDYNTLIINIL
jgi:hypothetical protein